MIGIVASPPSLLADAAESSIELSAVVVGDCCFLVVEEAGVFVVGFALVDSDDDGTLEEEPPTLLLEVGIIVVVSPVGVVFGVDIDDGSLLV